MVRRFRSGSLGPFAASQQPKQPPINWYQLLTLAAAATAVIATRLDREAYRWFIFLPTALFVLAFGSFVWTLAGGRITEYVQERRRHSRLLRYWKPFQSFQHRLHDLLRYDSSRGVKEALGKLHVLECRGKTEEVIREKQQRYQLLDSYISFATEQVARFIKEAATTPRSFEEGRELAWGFQILFTSVDSVGVVEAFRAAKATAGQEPWYTDWFDRFKSLVMEYETFASEANRAIGDNVFWVHVRVA